MLLREKIRPVVSGHFHLGGLLPAPNRAGPPSVTSFAINEDLPQTKDYIVGYVRVTNEDGDTLEIEVKNSTGLMYDPNVPGQTDVVVYHLQDDVDKIRTTIIDAMKEAKTRVLDVLDDLTMAPTAFTTRISPSLILHFLCVSSMPYVVIYVTRIEVHEKITLDIITQQEAKQSPRGQDADTKTKKRRTKQ